MRIGHVVGATFWLGVACGGGEVTPLATPPTLWDPFLGFAADGASALCGFDVTLCG